MVSIPKIVKDALFDLGWRKAMETKMDALHHNGTWDLVPLPSGKRIIRCKCVYTIKFSFDGSKNRLKAWLVDKGHTQTYGIDFEGTFSPIAKISYVRVLIPIASDFD